MAHLPDFGTTDGVDNYLYPNQFACSVVRGLEVIDCEFLFRSYLFKGAWGRGR